MLGDHHHWRKTYGMKVRRTFLSSSVPRLHGEADPYESHDLSKDPRYAARIELRRCLLAEINEDRGDPRGKGGRLIPQLEQNAPNLSPNYHRWKEAGVKWLSRVE